MKFTEIITEGEKGLWANIHAKRARIKQGSGEKMRKPGSKGAPSAQNFKDAATEDANPKRQAAIAIAKKKKAGVAENNQRGDTLVTDALKIMKGPEISDAILALKTVLGDREYNGRRGFYNFYVKQIIDMYRQQGVSEGGAKDRQWSNKDMERLRVATRDFDDIMASDGPDQTKHDLIKKRIKTKPMAGPKGALPEQGVAEELDPEHVEYLKRQADISRNTGLAVGDLVTLKNRPGFEGEIVHDWGGGDFTISGGGGGMSQSKNHRANARLIQKIQGLAEGANIMYAEELAEKVFNQSPNLQNEDDIMTRGFQLAKKDPSIGGRVNAIFRDEDFPSDFVSYYRWIQHNHGIASGVSEDWNKVNKSDKTSGMSQKAVNAYRRENPGSKLKTAVTTKPSKLKKGSKAANRRKSFCARMGGMKKAHASAKTKRDPDSPINKALRRWNCESIEQMQELVMIAEQKIRNLKK